MVPSCHCLVKWTSRGDQKWICFAFPWFPWLTESIWITERSEDFWKNSLEVPCPLLSHRAHRLGLPLPQSSQRGARGWSPWHKHVAPQNLKRNIGTLFLSLSHSFLSFFLNIKFTRHGHMMFLHVPTPFLFHHSYHLRFLWQEAGELIKMPDLWLFWKEEERPEFQLRSNEPVKTRWDAQISDQQYARLVSCTSLKWVPL